MKVRTGRSNALVERYDRRAVDPAGQESAHRHVGDGLVLDRRDERLLQCSECLAVRRQSALRARGERPRDRTSTFAEPQAVAGLALTQADRSRGASQASRVTVRMQPGGSLKMRS